MQLSLFLTFDICQLLVLRRITRRFLQLTPSLGSTLIQDHMFWLPQEITDKRGQVSHAPRRQCLPSLKDLMLYISLTSGTHFPSHHGLKHLQSDGLATCCLSEQHCLAPRCSQLLLPLPQDNQNLYPLQTVKLDTLQVNLCIVSKTFHLKGLWLWASVVRLDLLEHLHYCPELYHRIDSCNAPNQLQPNHGNSKITWGRSLNYLVTGEHPSQSARERQQFPCTTQDGNYVCEAAAPFTERHNQSSLWSMHKLSLFWRVKLCFHDHFDHGYTPVMLLVT